MQVHRTVVDGVLQFVPSPGYSDQLDGIDRALALRHGVDPARFVRESQSCSARGLVRGLYGRLGAGESTLVRCALGAMYAVVVDARPTSPTFGRAAGFLLDDTEPRRLYVPAGCLHGVQALTDSVDTCCRIDTPRAPAEEITVRVEDPDLAVRWPLPVATTAPRDRAVLGWADLCARLGVEVPERVGAVGW